MARSTRLQPKFDMEHETLVRAPSLPTLWRGSHETLLPAPHIETLELDHSPRRVTFVLSIRR